MCWSGSLSVDSEKQIIRSSRWCCDHSLAFIFNNHSFLCGFVHHCLMTQINIHVSWTNSVFTQFGVKHQSFIIIYSAHSFMVTSVNIQLLFGNWSLSAESIIPSINWSVVCQEMLKDVDQCFVLSYLGLSTTQSSSVYCHRGKRMFTFNKLRIFTVLLKLINWISKMIWSLFYSRRLIHWLLQFVCFYTLMNLHADVNKV